jgi:hypothetical protein
MQAFIIYDGSIEVYAYTKLHGMWLRLTANPSSSSGGEMAGEGKIREGWYYLPKSNQA